MNQNKSEFYPPTGKEGCRIATEPDGRLYIYLKNHRDSWYCIETSIDGLKLIDDTISEYLIALRFNNGAKS